MNIDALMELIARDGTRYLEKECTAKIISFLSDSGARLVDGTPVLERVSQLLPTLKSRLINTTYTGKYIYGLQRIIEELTNFADEELVVAYGFISSKGAGNIYLRHENLLIIGASVVDK